MSAVQNGSGVSTAINPFASLIPFIAGLEGTKHPTEPTPNRYLVAKGLPTLPVKLTERVWNLEYLDMEEFLPAPQTLRITEQKSAPVSLQDSLVRALGQFQAQCQQKSQRRVEDLLSWSKCFTLYVAVMAKQRAEMVLIMMAHFHTVYKLPYVSK